MRFTPVLALFALSLALPALPANAGDGTGAYLMSRGGIVKTSKGVCLRTSRWTEQNADRQCKEALKKLSTASTK